MYVSIGSINLLLEMAQYRSIIPNVVTAFHNTARFRIAFNSCIKVIRYKVRIFSNVRKFHQLYPALYISYYLKLNRIEYYDRMSEVRAKDNYEQWVKFFLIAIKESAEDAVDTIKQLSALHDKHVAKIEALGRQSKTARLLFDYIEKNPIIDIGKTATDLDISFNTASSYINRLVEFGILVQTNNAERNRVFSYEDYLAILRKDT